MTPTLAREIQTVDALVAAMEANTDDQGIRLLAMAQMEGQGLFDRDVLPPRLRQPFANLIDALRAVCRGDAQLYLTMVRCAFHTTRLVGRIYEDEQKGGPT